MIVIAVLSRTTVHTCRMNHRHAALPPAPHRIYSYGGTVGKPAIRLQVTSSHGYRLSECAALHCAYGTKGTKGTKRHQKHCLAPCNADAQSVCNGSVSSSTGVQGVHLQRGRMEWCTGAYRLTQLQDEEQCFQS